MEKNFHYRHKFIIPYSDIDQFISKTQELATKPSLLERLKSHLFEDAYLKLRNHGINTNLALFILGLSFVQLLGIMMKITATASIRGLYKKQYII